MTSQPTACSLPPAPPPHLPGWCDRCGARLPDEASPLRRYCDACRRAVGVENTIRWALRAAGKRGVAA